MNDFTSVPVAAVTSVARSNIDPNNSVTVTFSIDPCGPSFPETIIVSGNHPTLGIDLHYDVDRHRYQIGKMDPCISPYQLPQWKSCIHYVYILSIDTVSTHTVDNVRLVVSEARSANIKSVVVAFAKDDAPHCLSVVFLPQLYFNQLWIMKGHIANTVLAVVHKTIMGPKFNRRTLQKQVDWKEWLVAEFIIAGVIKW
jgi:hypothetical protein